MRLIAAAALAAAALTATAAHGAEAERARFGALKDGTAVDAVTLRNAKGIRVRLVAWGAMMQSLVIPDRTGKLADVMLSYPDMTGYQDKPQFFGATVGRFANRIAGATFALDGHKYTLAKNDTTASLHGGVKGFDKQLWSIGEVKSGPVASVTFTRVSPDGEEGYPGTLKASVTYALDDHNSLTVTYTATTDKPTVVNMSNHGLFNMAGAASGRSILDQRLTIYADAYTPVDAALIPTGEIKPVAGTDFDFRTPHLIGERASDGNDPQLVIGRGYDHNWVLKGGVTKAPRLAVRFEDPQSGRTMELFTTEPGLQFYSGNFLDATVVGVDHAIYREGSGIALEPQHFPDSPNQPSFPTTRLDPGQTYRHVSIYRFTTTPR
jgi:aldose 1-epimerase